ncbi:MAG: hypothetical protein ABI766_01165 [Gemmatimonadales bacterium]
MHESGGHVFHPGHQALHGVTVVIETNGHRTYVGRFDNQDDHGVNLLNVAVHDATAADQSTEEFLRRNAKFGIRVEHTHVLVPGAEVVRITPLDEVLEG